MRQSRKMPAEKRRSQLLKAAARIFGRKGYTRATTEDIARAAKLTKGSLYFHFKSKEDIFLAVIKEHHKDHMDVIMGIIRTEKDPLISIEKSIRAVLDVHEKFRYITPVFWQQAASIPVVRNYMKDQHDTLQHEVVHYMMDVARMKKKDAEMLFTVLHTSIDGMILHISGGIPEFERETFIQSMMIVVKPFLNENKSKR